MLIEKKHICPICKEHYVSFNDLKLHLLYKEEIEIQDLNEFNLKFPSEFGILNE